MRMLMKSLSLFGKKGWKVSAESGSRLGGLSEHCTCVYCDSVTGGASSKVDHRVLLHVWIPILMRTSNVSLLWR